MWGPLTLQRWPIGVVWFASYLVFLGTSYGTKRTYQSAMNSFHTIFNLLLIESPFVNTRSYPTSQVNIFMALAAMASYKAASTCRGAKCAAEDTWLLNGNTGPVIDAVLWKRMYKGILVYKGTSFTEKVAILPTQIRKKIEYMRGLGAQFSLTKVSIILADLLGVLVGLRRSEHLASAEKVPNRTTLLCFQNLAGATWDLGDCSTKADIGLWIKGLALDEIMKIRLCYTKHQRHRVAHQVVVGPGYRLMSIILWLKVLVKLRIDRGEKLDRKSPLLVRLVKGRITPMTGAFMSKMDNVYSPTLGWIKATLHSRRRGFATAAVRCGIHMASITIAMRHTQGVTMQYVALSIAERASITTRLAIASYHS